MVGRIRRWLRPCKHELFVAAHYFDKEYNKHLRLLQCDKCGECMVAAV